MLGIVKKLVFWPLALGWFSAKVATAAFDRLLDWAEDLT